MGAIGFTGKAIAPMGRSYRGGFEAAIHGVAGLVPDRPARPSVAGRPAAREPVARERAASPIHTSAPN